LLAVPAFGNWVLRHHGPICTINHCPGCQLREVYSEIYPGNRSHTAAQQATALGKVDGFFTDEAGNFPYGLGTNKPRWAKTVGNDRTNQSGQQDPIDFLVFL
jgi:hypothetical protein